MRGRKAEPVPGSVGLLNLHRSQSVPTAKDMTPPFGTVPTRSTPRLEVWLSLFLPQLRIPSLPLS